MNLDDDTLARPEAEPEKPRGRSPIPNARMFVKGQSGNPAGRPKQIHSVAALARQDTVAALKVLRDVMLNSKASPTARVAAANAILDRGWGRAPQTLDVTHNVAFGEEWANFMKQLAAGEPAHEEMKVIDHAGLEGPSGDVAGRPLEVRPGSTVPDHGGPVEAVDPRHAASDAVTARV